MVAEVGNVEAGRCQRQVADQCRGAVGPVFVGGLRQVDGALLYADSCGLHFDDVDGDRASDVGAVGSDDADRIFRQLSAVKVVPCLAGNDVAGGVFGQRGVVIANLDGVVLVGGVGGLHVDVLSQSLADVVAHLHDDGGVGILGVTQPDGGDGLYDGDVERQRGLRVVVSRCGGQRSLASLHGREASENVGRCHDGLVARCPSEARGSVLRVGGEVACDDVFRQLLAYVQRDAAGVLLVP